MSAIDVNAPLVFNAAELPANPSPRELVDTVEALMNMGAHIGCFDQHAGVLLERAACTLALVAFFTRPRPRLRLLRGGRS